LCPVARTVVGSEKERLFAAARVFVLTSYSENFGNTVLEAMRRGLPVVVTQEVGAADCGFVVAGDATSPGAAICRLTSDVDLAQSMGKAGQYHAMAHYCWPSIAVQMERLYECLKLQRS
jgi:glycosyltransferase involved in cell wall biosynthesis